MLGELKVDGGVKGGLGLLWCKMYYPRHIEVVVTRISKRKSVLVLTGARQVGKTTMLKEIYKDIKYTTHYY